MANWLKIIIGSVVSIIIVSIAGLFIFYNLFKKSLPDLEGVKDFENLNSRVEIYRDSFAIPYIFANNFKDAAFALGYLHAQERLFQMDIIRRAGQGRLSEIFGSATLPYDRMFKTIGMERVVKRDINKLQPEVKEILEAYSDGVNSFINEKKGSYPIEFNILSYEPYLWKPEHSLIVGKMMAWELNISWWTDIAFTHLIQKLGEEKVKEIIPDYPENAPTIIPKNIKQYPDINTALIETDQNFRNFIGYTGTHLGSNNWVVNKNKSSSGKPIIANDPHLSLQAPGKWYFAIIKAKDLEAEGFTLPGTPAVVIGKNSNISWAMTNVMSDDCDFYIEQLDSSGRQYFFNNKWNPLQINKYTIAVKDSEDVEITVKKTHRGPIISGIHYYDRLYPAKDTTAISMQWIGNEFTEEVYAMYLVNKAKNWQEFKQGLSHFSVPGQNFIYADNEGNIGYICAAKLPVRNSNNPTFVFNGSTSENDWKGFVPFEQMPQLFNPAENYIASANNKTISSFNYHISNLWEPPSRINRIVSLLTEKEKHSIEDFKKYQMDFISSYASEITGYLISAFDNQKINDKNLKTALNLLKGWDFSMDQYSQVPAIYLVCYQYLLENTFKDEMGENLYNQFIFMANVPYKVVNDLIKKDSSSWFDNVHTKEKETRDNIIRTSLKNAVKYLEDKFGNDPAYWQWGNLHKITFKHFFHGKSSLIDELINIGPYAIGGDGTTVFNTEYSFNKPFENNLGPSMRYLFDFAEPEYIYFILSTGQSGNVFSENYKDMSEMWLTGKYIKINVNQNYIKNAGYRLLVLE